MTDPNPKMTEILKKLLSDPRVIGVMTQVLIDIISQTQITETQPENAPAPVHQTPQKPKIKKERKPRIINWANSSNTALRQAYRKRKTKKLPIEPELEAELVRRFATYNTETHSFTGRQKKVITPAPVAEKQIDWAAKSDAALRQIFAYRKKHGLKIEPELKDILIARFAGYDPVTESFIGHRRKKSNPQPQPQKKERKPRIINWAAKSDDILRKAHKQRSKTTAGVDDALNAELARRFPGEYDATTRTFIIKQKLHYFGTKVKKESTAPTIIKKAPKPAESVTKTEPVTVTVTDRPTPVKPAKEPSEPVTEHLTVTIKVVKQSLEATYNNVYVNGQLILRNHANTHLEVFGDGTLLAIHGIVTNDSNLPKRPIWLVYNTDLVVNKWAGKDKFSGYDVYTSNLRTTPTGINIELSNRCTVLLDTEKLKRLAGQKRFVIER